MRNYLLASAAVVALALSAPFASAQEHSGASGAGGGGMGAAGGSAIGGSASQNYGGASSGSGSAGYSGSGDSGPQGTSHRAAQESDRHGAASGAPGHENGARSDMRRGSASDTDHTRRNSASDTDHTRRNSAEGTDNMRRNSTESLRHERTGADYGRDHNRGLATGDTMREGDRHNGLAGGGVRGGARLAGAERGRFVDTIRREHVSAIDHVDFDMNVGVIVPDRYHYYPLPEDIVSFVPQYRGYYFLVAEGDILIIDPDTHRIVDVIPEG